MDDIRVQQKIIECFTTNYLELEDVSDVLVDVVVGVLGGQTAHLDILDILGVCGHGAEPIGLVVDLHILDEHVTRPNGERIGELVDGPAFAPVLARAPIKRAQVIRSVAFVAWCSSSTVDRVATAKCEFDDEHDVLDAERVTQLVDGVLVRAGRVHVGASALVEYVGPIDGVCPVVSSPRSALPRRAERVDGGRERGRVAHQGAVESATPAPLGLDQPIEFVLNAREHAHRVHAQATHEHSPVAVHLMTL